MTMDLFHELEAAVSSWEFAGPGSVDDWEPGEDVDYDALARDIIEIAIAIVRPPLSPGDRIEVIARMADDPLPPPVGAVGTIVNMTHLPPGLGREAELQVMVRWDEGTPPAVNTLLVPHDQYVFRVLE